MELNRLEHVNLRTRDIGRLESWYADILGLKSGYRPPFTTIGRWLYSGEYPIVHLLEVMDQEPSDDPTNEHFALSATDLGSMIDKLEARGILYRCVRVPEIRILQVHLTDPDGNNLHVDFPPQEADELGLE